MLVHDVDNANRNQMYTVGHRCCSYHCRQCTRLQSSILTSWHTESCCNGVEFQ